LINERLNRDGQIKIIRQEVKHDRARDAFRKPRRNRSY